VNAWPSLPLEDWVDTRETVHLWTQILGKLKLTASPFVNQWWSVGLQLTARGLSTGLVPATPPCRCSTPTRHPLRPGSRT
jgi:hypothetical protein